MNTEDIQKFIETKAAPANSYVKIDFKKRKRSMVFLMDGDYKDLKAKNFWRIVTRKHFDEYNKSKNPNLARIFNGSEFSKLSLLTDGF